MAVVETHKGAIDVEIFLDGVIEDLVPLGEELPVGSVLAQCAGRAGAVPAAGDATPGSAPRPPRARVSPAARRRAQALGIEPDRLHGTGVEAR